LFAGAVIWMRGCWALGGGRSEGCERRENSRDKKISPAIHCFLPFSLRPSMLVRK
jgi:hypothetical protein